MKTQTLPDRRFQTMPVSSWHRIRRCISAVRISKSSCQIPKTHVAVEDSADPATEGIERLIWPSMLCNG